MATVDCRLTRLVNFIFARSNSVKHSKYCMLKTIIIHERDMIFLVIMHTHSVKEIIKNLNKVYTKRYALPELSGWL